MDNFTEKIATDRTYSDEDLLLLKKWEKYYPEIMQNLTEAEKEDILNEHKKSGAYFMEYHVFDFAHLSDEERAEYVVSKTAIRYLRRMALSEEKRLALKDKYACWQKLPEFYKRDICPPLDREAFIEFAGKHTAFIAKPIDGTGGHGVRFVNLKRRKITPEEYYDKYLSKRGYIVEELITQDPEMARFHPESVNTVRPVTFCKDGEVTILFAIMRMGCGSTKVDNTSSGGLCVAVDPENGRIVSGAVHRTDSTLLPAHPDSGIIFEGTQIPRWDELKELVTAAALKLADPPIVGWDLALSDKGWVIVELNWQPSFRSYQMLTRKGLRSRLESVTGVDFLPRQEKKKTKEKTKKRTGKKIETRPEAEARPKLNTEKKADQRKAAQKKTEKKKVNKVHRLLRSIRKKLKTIRQ